MWKCRRTINKKCPIWLWSWEVGWNEEQYEQINSNEGRVKVQQKNEEKSHWSPVSHDAYIDRGAGEQGDRGTGRGRGVIMTLRSRVWVCSFLFNPLYQCRLIGNDERSIFFLSLVEGCCKWDEVLATFAAATATYLSNSLFLLLRCSIAPFLWFR